MDHVNEALANANAHLASVGLPVYGQVVQHLRYLLEQAQKSDLPVSNGAIKNAANLLAAIDDMVEEDV